MSKYRYEYKQTDFGLERLLTVFHGKAIIGQRDPFMAGIPLNARRRDKELMGVAREIIREYEGGNNHVFETVTK